MAVERVRPFRIEHSAPFRDLLDLHSQVNRLLDDFFGPRAHPGGAERIWTPPADVYETRDELVVAVEIPGVKENDIHLTLVENTLVVKGHRAPTAEAREDHYYRMERWTGPFERHIQLPLPVQTDRVRATYREGVLEVRLPKVEEMKPREIKIEVA